MWTLSTKMSCPSLALSTHTPEAYSAHTMYIVLCFRSANPIPSTREVCSSSPKTVGSLPHPLHISTSISPHPNPHTPVTMASTLDLLYRREVPTAHQAQISTAHSLAPEPGAHSPPCKHIQQRRLAARAITSAVPSHQHPIVDSSKTRAHKSTSFRCTVFEPPQRGIATTPSALPNQSPSSSAQP